MNADLSLLAAELRRLLAGCCADPSPVRIPSATRTVEFFHEGGFASAYVAGRLTYVIRRFERGPDSSGMVGDALLALGEYETLRDLQSGQVTA